MKKIIALLCAGVFMMTAFTGCKKTFYDEYGNPHKVQMKHGEPVQDEYGRLIEKYKDEDGKTVEYPFEFLDVLKTGKNTIENAFIKLDIPKEWNFDEEKGIFRIHHSDCSDEEAPCELTVEINREKSVEDFFIDNSIAEKKLIAVLTGEEKVTGYEEFTTKLFGKEIKGFRSNHFGKYDFYCYFMDCSGSSMRFVFVINNECFDGKFDPEKFMSENITLKKIPTK